MQNLLTTPQKRARIELLYCVVHSSEPQEDYTMTDATTQAATPAPTHPLPTLLQTLLADVGEDVLATYEPQIAAALSSLQATGSISNVLTQAAKVEVEAPLALPTLENVVVQQTAGVLAGALTQINASAAAKLTAAGAGATPAIPAL